LLVEPVNGVLHFCPCPGKYEISKQAPTTQKYNIPPTQ